MAYLALARKWRPKAFSEVVGQTHVVQALSNALDTGRVHHAFLFTGTRGVGKTTLARIFAKSLNCEEGTSAEPCQQCNTCVSIDEGRYVDLIEVDAASRTKVDDTRELLENVQYAPTYGKIKVFLIDEVHMLSTHSFNALLKTLEEPPEHVKFLFATTDPQKLPVTVLSRCLQFNLRAMRPEQVENQLIKILGKEDISFDQAALHAIAKAADGSMRDGLSLLDQAIAQGGGEVKLGDVEGMLGTIKSAHTEAILQALASHNVDQALDVVAEMADSAVDFSLALDDVLMQLYYVSLAQLAPNALASTDANTTLITQLAQTIPAETLQLFYQIGLISKRDIPLAPSLRVGFEMALLRMLAFEPSDQSGDVISPIDNSPINAAPQRAPQVQTQSSGAPNAEPAILAQAMPQTAPQPIAEPQPIVESQPESVPQLNSIPQADPVVPQVAPAPAQPQPAPQTAPKSASAPAPQMAPIPAPQVMAAPAAEPQPQASVIAVTLAGNNEWGELVEQTKLDGFAKELAMNCACERLSDDKVTLSLSPKTEHLLRPDRVDAIQEALRAAINPNVVVSLDVEESDKETPAECLARLGYEQVEQAKENIRNDPGVKAIMSEFGATLNEESIKPIQ